MTINKPKPNKKKTKLGATINVSDLSEATVDVIAHFGINAPGLLNEYSIALEDALIEQVNHVVKLRHQVAELQSIVIKLETNAN